MLAVAIRPAVRGALHPGCARFHVILRVEVTARRIGRADRVNRGEAFVVPQRFERRQTRMQPEMTVEIHDIRRGNGDARALLVILRLAVRTEHLQAVDRTALKEADETRTRGAEGAAQGVRSATEKQGIEAQAYQRQAASLYEHASRDRHCL